eukprot:scaffold1706_cov116-Cylindrotheca_fusiformis.AAC.3
MFDVDQSRLSDESHAAMLGRIEASILGESALVDRETGRVYWEGGGSSTLYETFGPKIDQYGLDHMQTALLTGLITLVFIGVLAGWLRRLLDQSNLSASSTDSFVLSSLLTAANWTIMRLPKIENRWLVIVSVALYFLESYHCSTRYYLANALSSPTELEEYINRLREEKPVVTWKVSSFHYEKRRMFSLSQYIRALQRKLARDKDVLDIIPRPKNCKNSFPFTKKVVTHQASATYKYESCLDSTMAGVWKRATLMTTNTAPFTKIALTVLLVLADKKSREDYFRQQSEFFNQHGRGDELTEFSTDIKVHGYRPNMLAVRPVEGVLSTRLFRLYTFWFFTLCGLTLPYRIWFKRHCDFLRVSVVKETSTVVNDERSYWKWLPSSKSSTDMNESHFLSFMKSQSLYAEKRGDALMNSTHQSQAGDEPNGSE